MHKIVTTINPGLLSAPAPTPAKYRLMPGAARWGRGLAHAFGELARFGGVLPIGAASAVSALSLAAYGQVSIPLAAAAFLLVYASYLIDHLAEVGRFDDDRASERSRALARRKRLCSLCGFAAFGGAAALTLITAGPVVALVLLSFPLAVVLYGTTWFGRLTGGTLRIRRLKDIPGFKAFYTAFFWGLLMVYADLFIAGTKPFLLQFFFGYMFLSFFLNTVYCDFKDLERDRLEGLSTLPLMLGIPTTLRLLGRINLAALIWLLAFAAVGWIPVSTLGLLLAHGYVCCVLRHGKTVLKAGCFPGDAAMDAEFAFWLPCALLGRWFLGSIG